MAGVTSAPPAPRLQGPPRPTTQQRVTIARCRALQILEARGRLRGGLSPAFYRRKVLQPLSSSGGQRTTRSSYAWTGFQCARAQWQGFFREW